MSQWEVFVNDVSELAEDRELELTVRTLEPGIHKYTYRRVRAKVSAATETYPDQLQVRLGRGQLSPRRFSMHVLAEVPRIPAKYL